MKWFSQILTRACYLKIADFTALLSSCFRWTSGISALFFLIIIYYFHNIIKTTHNIQRNMSRRFQPPNHSHLNSIKQIKGTVSVNQTNPPCKEGKTRFTTGLMNISKNSFFPLKNHLLFPILTWHFLKEENISKKIYSPDFYL